MKAIAVTPQQRKVEIINQAEPKIVSPTDVKLRMLEAGVCGTDKEICAFEYGTPPAGSEQLVIGHESLGEVVEIGLNVTRVKVGDIVVPMVRRPCLHAGGAGFDDSKWEIIDPTTLDKRRSAGRLAFNWYRIKITVPERVGNFDPTGSTLVFATSLDDYAEIWVDGELPRAAGQSGGSVIKGWNAENQLIVGRDVKPGQKIQLAIFGINGPVSNPPTNYIYMPGDLLSLTTMMGQSNDWFYAPAESGIALFKNDKPISGDITAQIILWDAGTEVNQEPGIGPDQGPRQKAPNTGEAENGVVRNAKDVKYGSDYTKVSSVMRVTIKPVQAPGSN